MPGVITRYHQKFLPKGGSFFSGEMSKLRSNRAKQIKTLRSQMGRKKARSTIIQGYKSHVSGMVKAKKLAAAKSRAVAGQTRTPQWRKRGGGKVTHRKLVVK